MLVVAFVVLLFIILNIYSLLIYVKSFSNFIRNGGDSLKVVPVKEKSFGCCHFFRCRYNGFDNFFVAGAAAYKDKG
jgi:hypothetical protein